LSSKASTKPDGRFCRIQILQATRRADQSCLALQRVQVFAAPAHEPDEPGNEADAPLTIR
jgi:hypothetical protein